MRDPAPPYSIPLLLLIFAATACAEGDSATAGRWEATVDTIADTVVVRTTAGMTWPDTMELVPEVVIGVLDGEQPYMFGRVGSLAVDPGGRIWVVDSQVPEVRIFAPDGTYLRTVGRPGEGPGELGQPDGGFAVLSDGRALVRDPGNARIQLYGPDGEPLTTWTVRGNFFTSNPLWRDREDHVYTPVLLDPEAGVADWRMGLARIAPDGSSTDTLPVPDAAYEAPTVEARRENSVSRNNVPFSAGEEWTFHPDGYFVHGIGDRYSFTLLKDPTLHGGPPLRVERQAAPVAVRPAEAESQRRRVTRNMRRMVPDWTWNGPPVPDSKPPFRDLHTGRDGRIWVLVSTPGVEEPNPDYDPEEEGSEPTRWTEPVAFDVFEPDGTFLGHVRAPTGFDLFPTPIFDAENVWAVTEDELGVNRVVRFRLEPAGGDGES